MVSTLFVKIIIYMKNILNVPSYLTVLTNIIINKKETYNTAIKKSRNYAAEIFSLLNFAELQRPGIEYTTILYLSSVCWILGITNGYRGRARYTGTSLCSGLDWNKNRLEWKGIFKLQAQFDANNKWYLMMMLNNFILFMQNRGSNF